MDAKKLHLQAEKASLVPGEVELERALRPESLDAFCGQEKTIDNLRVFVRAACERGDSLDHLLLHGPPGLGKTSLAHIIASEMGAEIKVSAGPVLDKPATLANILTHLGERSVFFIDEIHRLHPSVEEYLYGAMEDFKLAILLDPGAAARSVELKIPPFTLVGATTRSGLLTSPLRARFGIKARLSYYPATTLCGILLTNAQKLNISLDKEGAEILARCSRGTPRIANHLLRRTRDFAQVEGASVIGAGIAARALKALDVDEGGLDEMDKRLLSTLVEKFSGGPVGLSTLAIACGEEAGTIEEVYEPFLIQEGYLKRTPRGREATTQCYTYLGLPSTPVPPPEKRSLFD